MSTDNGYVMKVLIGIDMLASVLLFRDPNVTISSETGLELLMPRPALWARVLGWLLNHLQANHCTLAIQGDIARAKSALVELGVT